MNRKSSPAWSIPGRKHNKEHFTTPGPGAYANTTAHFKAAPNYGTGRAPRSGFPINSSPGPGAYDNLPPGERNQRTIFGSSQRAPLTSENGYPGPGSYNLGALQSRPGISMQGRSASTERITGPGPGAYTARDTLPRAPQFGFGSASRSNLSQSHINPGPGHYESTTNLGGPSWPICGRADQSNRDSFPGPGSYNAPDVMSKSAISITGRYPQRPTEKSPGPGDYNPMVQTLTRLGGVADRAQRFRDKSRDTPGPGTYEPPRSASVPKYMFGRSSQRPQSMATASPGPGNYDLGSNIGRGPNYSIQGRYEKDRLRKSMGAADLYSYPGPGHYNVPSGNVNTQSTPAYKIGSESRGVFIAGKYSKDNPGPGLYDVRGNLMGPKYSFGNDRRDKGLKEGTPGPGQYEIKSSVAEVPPYLLTSRG